MSDKTKDINNTEITQKQKRQIFSARTLAILDTIPQMLTVWDKSGQQILVNKTTLDVFKFESSEDMKNHIGEIFPEIQPNGEESKAYIRKQLAKTFNESRVNFFWLNTSRTGEEIPCEVTATRLTIDGETYVVMSAMDLRPYLVGASSVVASDGYFFDQISGNVLFNTLANLSDDLFFVLDLRTSKIQFLGGFAKTLGVENRRYSFPKVILKSDYIYADDISIFSDLATDMQQGKEEQYDIRMQLGSAQPEYYQVSYKIQSDKNNHPIFAVGKASNIDEQKSLEIQAKTDLLTGCLNKISTENEIQRIITKNSEGEQHAFFIVDIDNFKNVNDSLGHHFGDIVLSEVANKLKNCFRSVDIVGRIGGDEFIVFARGLRDLPMIMEKAEIVAKSFRNTYSGEKNEYKISGSIGISRFPLDGNCYEDLYKAADKALYQSKKRGKDCFTFYSKELVDGTMRNRTLLENANRAANDYADTALIATIFNLLYETKDISSSVNIALKLLGAKFSVDRSYIFETFDGGSTYANTYEWCAPGITAEKNNLQCLTAEVLSDFFNDASPEGIVFSNDLTVLTADGAYEVMDNQGILSFLHSQVRKDDIVEVFLGFDDCTTHRIWTETEINTITLLSKLISTFLLVERQKR